MNRKLIVMIFAMLLFFCGEIPSLQAQSPIPYTVVPPEAATNFDYDGFLSWFWPLLVQRGTNIPQNLTSLKFITNTSITGGSCGGTVYKGGSPNNQQDYGDLAYLLLAREIANGINSCQPQEAWVYEGLADAIVSLVYCQRHLTNPEIPCFSAVQLNSFNLIGPLVLGGIDDYKFGADHMGTSYYNQGDDHSASSTAWLKLLSNL